MTGRLNSKVALVTAAGQGIAAQGCAILQPYDIEVGAGTMAPETFLRVLGPKPYRVAYVQQGLLGPTVPAFWVYNPAYAQVQNEHVWSVAWTDIMTGGMTPQAAAEKAFKRVEEIFAKYPILQS